MIFVYVVYVECDECKEQGFTQWGPGTTIAAVRARSRTEGWTGTKGRDLCPKHREEARRG